MEPDWVRPVVHWEIHGNDFEKLTTFYGELFNWPMTGEGRIRAVTAGIGAPEPIRGHFMRDSAPGIILSIQVLNLRATLDRVPEFGGAVTREPFDIPGPVTIAWITDPEGNRLVLVQQ